MVEGGGEGAGRGVTSSGPRGGGAAGRRNREVTFNPSGAGCKGARGLGEEARRAGTRQASRLGGRWLGGSPGTLAEAGRKGTFSPSLFPEFSSSSYLARKAGLFAVLDEADTEYGCIIQKYSEAIVLFGGSGLIQNLLRGPDLTQFTDFQV